MKRSKKAQNISGNLLLSDFQSAFITLATAEYARQEARHNEQAVVSELASLSSHAYLQPGSIDLSRQPGIERASLNAHVMKVQAEQIQQMSVQQLAQVEEQIQHDYIGRKVLVSALGGAPESPFDAVWFNPGTGYRSNALNKRQVRGVIKEISLSKNLLVLKPLGATRFINRDLTAYLVYPINPEVLEPLITIDLL